MNFRVAENSDQKSHTFPSKSANVEWMMVIISCLSDEPRKKIKKPQKPQKPSKKSSIYLQNLSPPSPQPVNPNQKILPIPVLLKPSVKKNTINHPSTSKSHKLTLKIEKKN